MNSGYLVLNVPCILEDSHTGLGTTGVTLYTGKSVEDCKRWAKENAVHISSEMIRGDEGRKQYEEWLLNWKK